MSAYENYREQWKNAENSLTEFPTHVDIELASICNLKCVFCPHSLKKSEKQWPQGFMPFELFKKIIDDIQGKVPAIKLNLRGESTLHPSFELFLTYVRNLFVDIRGNTNGNYPSSLNAAIAKTYTNWSFSCDALYKETYEKLRIKGDHKKLWDNVEEVYRLNPKIVHFSYVVTEQNRHELSAFENHIKTKYPLATIFSRPAMSRTEKSDYMLKGEYISKGRKDCGMPMRRLSIDVEGSVYPCCVMWYPPFIIVGNAKEKNVIDIWNDLPINSLRKNLKLIDVLNSKSKVSKKGKDENTLVIEDLNLPEKKATLPLACVKCQSSESFAWEKQSVELNDYYRKV